RHPAPTRIQARVALGFREMAFPIVEKNMGSTGDRIHNQIQISVAINIAKERARDIEVRAVHPARERALLESPIPQVPKQLAAPGIPAEEQVAPTVTVNIAARDPRPVQQNLIGKQSLFREVIGE